VTITIAISNQKGGTAKTTTSVTLAHKLAMEGRQVLIIDTDVQGHATLAMGLDKAPGIYRMVQRFQALPETLLMVNARERLDVLPSDKTTEPAKRILAGVDFRERVLADTLQELDGYDVAVIDCAPSLDVLHVAALVAADWLVIPTKLDYLAVDGVNEVLASLAEIKKRSEHAPELLGILPTFFDRTTNETMMQLRSLVDSFGDLVLPPIPVDTKLREAPAYGETVWEYAPSTRSVVGITGNNGSQRGGYLDFIDRVEKVL
jgi:chromosome partitioning protein